MKTILKLIMLTLGTCFSHVSGAQNFSAYQTPQDWVIAKNYYATFLLAQDSGLTHTILSDQDIYSMLEKRHARYIESGNCKDVACFLRAFRWEEQEVEKIISVFSRKFQTNKELKAFVANKLIPSRTYGMDVSAGERGYLEKALRQDLNAMNYVIDVYAGAKKPNYPKIDSISFDVTKKAYLYLLKDVAQDILKDVRNPEEAFYESLWTAVRLLEVNERWDAAQLEPLIQLENKKAYDAIRQTDFERYPYSLLLTLGAGPEVYDQPISPGGMLRCRMAARSYFQGLAPFIVVSGGRVHPYKTPYIEAIEMKKYLMQALNVPEEAILIDPHARHTTTNMRNTARILLHYGFPADKYAIVNSSIPHIDAVEKMADRCVRELGYVPYVLGKRISEVIIEFKPREEALTIDPDEPMDP
ncbi:YdcF family protein [Sphingobacterium spiritivorum]|uniref:YdcF family protein n=1 Tax=Sphingobacterium spiritivorum TaxID=258 RepID=UPI003DA4A087